MPKSKLSRIFLPVLSLLITMWAISLACLSNAHKEGETAGGCTILPEGFSQEDLAGTWVAGSPSYPKSSDTLIIRSDGTYKQIIWLESQSDEVEYESDWQAWSFEYRENGTGYLYLDDYRGCAANTGRSCDWVNDGKIPWADVCERQWMDPGPRAGQIILVVRGIPGRSGKNTSHPFFLTLFNGFESSPWSYAYQEK